MAGKVLRLGVTAVVTAVIVVAIGLLAVMSSRKGGVDTSSRDREIRFYRQGTEWFADVPRHTQAENQMVAGADTLLEAFSGGKDTVRVTLSSDIDNPKDWHLHLHLVEHDRYGATYKVRDKEGGSRLAWLCNVMHTVFGGEHPTDIYVHEIAGE
jgi:hypothetical protein